MKVYDLQIGESDTTRLFTTFNKAWDAAGASSPELSARGRLLTRIEYKRLCSQQGSVSLFIDHRKVMILEREVS